jgi:hypothetical protein
LLENNADPNKEFGLGNNIIKTCIQYAINENDIRMAYLLIKFGAKADYDFLQKQIKNKQYIENFNSNYTLMRCVFEKKFLPTLFKYYTEKTKISIVFMIYCLRSKFLKKLKNSIILYMLNFMI